MQRTLATLNPGECGVVLSVGNDDERLKHRLIDMGITPGLTVKLTKKAPMGDPLEISLRGYSLSLRGNDAAGILLVEKDKEQTFLTQLQERRERLARSSREGLAEYSTLDCTDEHSKAQVVRLTDFFIANENCKKCDMCAERNIPEQGELHLALAGNPNSGKTTLFNALTGSKEYVGNWPGVTVEKKEGKINLAADTPCDRNGGFCTHGHTMVLVDLPGVYSLSPHSMEEIIARKYILEEKPDAIINIVDATNLERNLYLTVQLMELGVPIIIALNMMDEVEKHGDSIDCVALSKALGVPVVPISARTGKGVNALMQSAQKLLNAAHLAHHFDYKVEPDVFYDDFTHVVHHKLGALIEQSAVAANLPLHFAEIKLLERDPLVMETLALSDETKQNVDTIIREYSDKNELGDTEVLIADSRYAFLENAVATAYTRSSSSSAEKISDKIDRILTHKYFALPIFLVIMALIFTLTFSTVGAWLSDLVGQLINVIIPATHNALASINVVPWLNSLVCDGIIAGVGGVLTFLPQIAILFFMLSLLEDSGYMARIAFIMDKPMRKLGLSGKAIIPLLMGFGCTVPATMGARTMDNENDKRMTILLIPFMSCSAKLPIYALIAGAFFARGKLLVIFGLYLIGVLCGLIAGFAFKGTIFKNVDSPFLIELPPYRMPSTKNTLTHVWERVEHFLIKAGTLIFAMSVVLWFLLNFNFTFNMVSDQHQSILGIIGGFIAPVFTPTGFPYWQAVVALMVGWVAKEAVVSALAMFYSFSAQAGAFAVQSALAADFTAASAFSFLVFVLLYTPCIAAVTAMRTELNSRKWTAFAIINQLVIAYVVSTLTYAIFNAIL